MTRQRRCAQCGKRADTDPCSSCAKPDEYPPALAGIFRPPWTEHGQLYGPRTSSAFERDLKTYSNEAYGAIGSPAQWDPEEQARVTGRASAKHLREAPRKDAAMFERLFEWLVATSPEREMQCATLFWRGTSVGNIARIMGVAVTTVREWIHRMRKRMRRDAV